MSTAPTPTFSAKPLLFPILPLNPNRHFDTSIGGNFASSSGTEELGHLEMVGAMVQQLTRGLTAKEIEDGGFDAYYVGHGLDTYPASAGGIAFDATAVAAKGDPIADLTEDMAAEQKARATYENILRLSDDPDIIDPLRFLREREIVHFQRFGEALMIVQNHLDAKKVY